MRRKKVEHPMQPLVMESGTVRFKRNKIIDWLCKAGLLDLNQIARMKFEPEDRIQLAQLLGYSISGFCDLSYVPRSVVREVTKAADDFINQ